MAPAIVLEFILGKELMFIQVQKERHYSGEVNLIVLALANAFSAVRRT